MHFCIQTLSALKIYSLQIQFKSDYQHLNVNDTARHDTTRYDTTRHDASAKSNTHSHTLSPICNLAQIKFTLTSGAKVKCSAPFNPPPPPFSQPPTPLPGSGLGSACNTLSMSDQLTAVQAAAGGAGGGAGGCNLLRQMWSRVLQSSSWLGLVLSIFQVQRQKDFQFQIR